MTLGIVCLAVASFGLGFSLASLWLLKYLRKEIELDLTLHNLFREIIFALRRLYLHQEPRDRT